LGPALTHKTWSSRLPPPDNKPEQTGQTVGGSEMLYYLKDGLAIGDIWLDGILLR